MYDYIVDLLARQNVPFRVHEHAVAHTVAEVEERLSFPIDRIVKAIAFKTKAGQWLIVGLKGRDRLDYRALAAAAGVRRGDLQRASPSAVAMDLGYPAGAVCPIPPRPDVTVIVDAAVAELGTVYCGIGRADRTLEIAAPDLIAASEAKIAAVAARSAT